MSRYSRCYAAPKVGKWPERVVREVLAAWWRGDKSLAAVCRSLGVPYWTARSWMRGERRAGMRRALEVSGG